MAFIESMHHNKADITAIYVFSPGTIDEIADRCCAIGEQWFTQNRERCTDYPSPLRGVAEEDKAGCLSVIQVRIVTLVLMHF